MVIKLPRSRESTPVAVTPPSTTRDLDTPAHAVSLDLPQRARQLLDSYSTGSTGKALTAPRQRLDGASTARQLDSQGSTPLLLNFKYETSETELGRKKEGGAKNAV